MLLCQGFQRGGSVPPTPRATHKPLMVFFSPCWGAAEQLLGRSSRGRGEVRQDTTCRHTHTAPSCSVCYPCHGCTAAAAVQHRPDDFLLPRAVPSNGLPLPPCRGDLSSSPLSPKQIFLISRHEHNAHRSRALASYGHAVMTTSQC